MSVATNIKMLRRIFGVTQKELAEIAGVSENAVSKWENGYADPRMGAIERIAACYGLTKSHLIEDGGMSQIDPITKKPKPFSSNAIKVTFGEYAKVPLIGRVHAGKPTEAESIDYECIAIPKFLVDSDTECYACIAEGDCMNKVYPEGCLIVVSPNKQPVNGSVAVVTIDGHDAVMRRMYRTTNTLVLSPDSFNPEHKDIVISEDDDHTVEFLGKVVWFQSKEELA